MLKCTYAKEKFSNNGKVFMKYKFELQLTLPVFVFLCLFEENIDITQQNDDN